MTVKEMEYQLNKIESSIKPDMFDSFSSYISRYRDMFIQIFGEEKDNEPDFIRDIRVFLKIDHTDLAVEYENDTIIDFSKAKNVELLRDYYSKGYVNDICIPQEIADINMEDVSVYIKSIIDNVEDKSFIGRRQKREYKKMVDMLGK